MQADSPLTAEIRYYLRGGKPLAREVINYRADTYAPDLVFTDAWDGRRETVQKHTQGFTLSVQASAKSPTETQRLDYSDTDYSALTIPGLPQFVEQHWNRFVAGEKIVFFCVFPVQKKLLRMRARLDHMTRVGKFPAMVVRMQPDNFVYRWFSDPVYLTFLLKNKRLVRYQGLHYIRDPRTGGGSIVDLTFSW